MDLYRAETYKQLQALNLLDVVIVSRLKRNHLFVHLFVISYNETINKNISRRKVAKAPNF
jgi:hypothetical protein